VLRIDIEENARPRALGFDESGATYWLESREDGANGGNLGRIRRQAAGPAGKAELVADGLVLKPGRCALLGWRGLCFLAAPPAIRLIEVDRDGGPAMIESLDPTFEVAQEQDAAGFGGLGMAPDGRVYGSFSGGTAHGVGEAPGTGNAVFRFEPDGSGFELVHRGLLRPSAPVFDDLGRARLIDRVDGKEPGIRWLPLLDGAFGGGGGKPFPSDGVALPEAAATAGFELVFWLTREPDGGAARLAWGTPGASLPGDPEPDPAPLIEGAKIIDLASDWNGVPHLLIFRDRADGEPKTIEILAFGGAQADAPAAESLKTINAHFDDPKREDVTDLLDLLSDPERRIRWQAAWALSRNRTGLTLLNHAIAKGDAPSLHAALAGIGVIARRGAGAAVPGDDRGFSPLPRTELARQAAVAVSGLLANPAPELRAQALRILGGAHRPAGLIPFSAMLADPDPGVRNDALLAAGHLRWQALVSTLETARSKGGLALDTARLADALAAIYPPEHLPIYGRRNSNQQLRLAAVEALQRHGHEGLAGFVFDSDPEVASAAVLGIDRWHLDKVFGVVAARVSQGSIEEWSPEARQAALRCAPKAER